MAIKDDILAFKPGKPVHVDAYGGVYIRPMTGDQRDEYESFFLNRQGKSLAGLRALLGVMSICDEDGKLQFSMADRAALGATDASELDKVFDAVQTLNKLTADDIAETAGNSKAAPSGDSG